MIMVVLLWSVTGGGESITLFSFDGVQSCKRRGIKSSQSVPVRLSVAGQWL